MELGAPSFSCRLSLVALGLRHDGRHAPATVSQLGPESDQSAQMSCNLIFSRPHLGPQLIACS